MDTRTFIDNVAAGKTAEAKDNLIDLISSKAFDALEAKKQEIAQSLFRDKEETVEVQETEDQEPA